MTTLGWLGVLFSALSRLAYFVFLSRSLLQAQAGQGGLLRYKVFKGRISALQTLDGIAFITACVVSSGTFEAQISTGYPVGLGAMLIVVGITVKAWAVSCLGAGSYTWRDFFVPEQSFVPCRSGPYRWFKDPMYTIGYLQVYGIALVALSLPGVVLALFLQGTMLVVSESVEKSHLSKLSGRPVESYR